MLESASPFRQVVTRGKGLVRKWPYQPVAPHIGWVN